MRRLPRSAEPKCTEPGMGALGEGARGCMCKGTHTRACTHPCMHARTRAHTHTHPCMHAHTRVCTRTRPVLMLAAPVHAHRWGARTRARGKVGAHTCTLLGKHRDVHTRMCMHSCASKHLVHAHTHARGPVQASGACTHARTHTCTHTHSCASIWCMHTCTRARVPVHALAHPCTLPCMHSAVARSLLPAHAAAAPRCGPSLRARRPCPAPRAPQARRAFVFLPGCPLSGAEGPERRRGSHTNGGGRTLPPGRAGGGEMETPAPRCWRGLGAPGGTGVLQV